LLDVPRTPDQELAIEPFATGRKGGINILHPAVTGGTTTPPIITQTPNIDMSISQAPLPPSSTPANSHPISSLKHMATSLSNVTPTTLKPLADFYNINFSSNVIKEKLQDLSVKNALYTFAIIHVDDNCVKILNSMGRYVTPLGGEENRPKSQTIGNF